MLPGCCTRAPLTFDVLIFASRFSCKTLFSKSGAEGIRTPDLRRAKADSYCYGCSLLFKNSCKQAYSILCIVVSVRRCLSGLLHGCCTAGYQTDSSCRTGQTSERTPGASNGGTAMALPLLRPEGLRGVLDGCEYSGKFRLLA